MEQRGFRRDMRGLVVIVTPVLAEVARHIFNEAGVEVRYEVNGQVSFKRFSTENQNSVSESE